MRTLSVVCRWLANLWLALFFLSVVLSVVGMFLHEPTLALGWRRVTDTFSPFNIINTAVMLLLILPGIGLYKLSGYLAKKAPLPSNTAE